MRLNLLLFLSLFWIILSANAQNFKGIDFRKLEKTHDISLSPWGPYTKRYAGISHLPEMARGYRFDVSATNSPGKLAIKQLGN